ncbi:hypothetical protein KDW40_25385 [Burkholderia cenocepacia]|uniref:Uncharacterized protein n=1 Tax=Burkholderia gladioli (strain BSR3) TaxID=999541 RepID=F2LSE3_BURGS|nr:MULTISPECIES: hypothetical protein [Burkholderia]AEA65739.1 hypothetical protein bgla_3p0380 [Burkholderia gladioli BSR3]MBR8043475.1 hypothetical protein [Burkholderia cenocepacia]MBR8329064.1 hypothetical protein [Burkholderia cenocepacia]
MFGTVFSKALTARGHWAMKRICEVANAVRIYPDHTTQALHFARESGREAGRLDAALGLWCPHLLTDVPELHDAWQTAFDEVRSRLDALRTPEGIEAWLARVSKAANHGTGLVYEVFSRNFSCAVDNGLGDIPSELHAFTLERAKYFGYETAEEREATWAEMEADGLCSHGLDAMTCPCGCFEGD